MTLDDFLNECKKRGATPLNYRSHTETINGSRTVEYENPKYREAKARLAEMLGRIKQTGNPNTDNLLNRLYGEDVVIRTANGYHYGKLYGFDGKNFLLDNYHFDKRMIDFFEYSIESLFGEDTIVPAENIISISKIPLMTEEFV